LRVYLADIAVELALNLVWFSLVSLLGVAFALRCAGRLGATSVWTRRECLSGLVVVLLLASIALPVISLTDDLQAMTAVTESNQALRAITQDSVMVACVQSAIASLNLLQTLPTTWDKALTNPWDSPPLQTRPKRTPAEQRPPPTA
jgi:hypothetical protein